MKRVIDRKFKFVAVNPITGKVYTEENALILCAKDKAVLPALLAYQQKCIELGANHEHIESVGKLIERVEAFQTEVECRTPDTIGDEIPRCLHGVGV